MNHSIIYIEKIILNKRMYFITLLYILHRLIFDNIIHLLGAMTEAPPHPIDGLIRAAWGGRHPHKFCIILKLSFSHFYFSQYFKTHFGAFFSNLIYSIYILYILLRNFKLFFVSLLDRNFWYKIFVQFLFLERGSFFMCLILTIITNIKLWIRWEKQLKELDKIYFSDEKQNN